MKNKRIGRPPMPKGKKKKQIKFYLTPECAKWIDENGGSVVEAVFIERRVSGRIKREEKNKHP